MSVFETAPSLDDQLNPLERAIAQILADYGDTVSVVEKNKRLVKFGVNPNVNTTQEMVWSQGGIEVLPTSGNPIDTVSSSNAGDTQDIVIEGHTLSGSELTFVTQTVTLNGQNKVTLATPLYRANRMYNNDNTVFAGDVYAYQDGAISGGVPNTAADIHLKADADNNQSLKCATSLSNTDYWIITGVTIGVNRSASRAVAFDLQIKEFGKVFRTRVFASGSSENGSQYLPQDPCLVVPKNADVRVLCTSTGSTTGCETTIHGYLAAIQ